MRPTREARITRTIASVIQRDAELAIASADLVIGSRRRPCDRFATNEDARTLAANVLDWRRGAV